MESSVAVEDRPGRGRALVAARDIRAGEELLRETAYCSVTLEEWRGEVCHQCFSPLRQVCDDIFSGMRCDVFFSSGL